jgi:O-antigen ligase
MVKDAAALDLNSMTWKRLLWVLVPVAVLVCSFVEMPKTTFAIVLSAALLLYAAGVWLMGRFTVEDIPVLFLILGTFASGRAFSVIGLKVGNLEVFVTEMALGLALVLLALKAVKQKSLGWLWDEWRSPLPKSLVIVLPVYFLMGTLYLLLGIKSKGSLALRDIVFCHYLLLLFLSLGLFKRAGKVENFPRFLVPGIMVLLYFGMTTFFIYIPRHSAYKLFARTAKMHNLALYCGLLTIFALSYFTFVKKRLKPLMGILMYLGLLLIVMAEVRAGWAGFIVALILMAILMKKKMLIIVLIIAAVAVSLFIIDHFNLTLQADKMEWLQEQVKSVARPSQQSMPAANIKWRLGIWEETFHEIVKKPLLGWGFGAQVDYLIWGKRLSKLKAMGANTGILPPHNHVLAIAYKMGLLGLALFLFINFRVFFHGVLYLKTCNSEFNRRFLIALLAGLTYWHGMAFFFDILESPPTSIFLWILLGAILAVVHVDRKMGKVENR